MDDIVVATTSALLKKKKKQTPKKFSEPNELEWLPPSDAPKTDPGHLRGCGARFICPWRQLMGA